MLPDIEILKAIIKDAAMQEILPRFNAIGYEIKEDGSLLTEADLAVDKSIREALALNFPEIGFLSEEMELAEQQELLESSSQLWVLDPLDGTSNFAAGIPFFATSLALIIDGEVHLGLSYDVVRDEMFCAVKDQGAFLNNDVLKCQKSDCNLDDCVAIIDFKYLQTDLAFNILKNKPFRSQRNLGATVLEWAWMAASRGQVYLHGGMKLWDLAAGSLILSEAGGYSCTIDNEPVFKASMPLRSVIASPDKVLFKEWKDYVLNNSNYLKNVNNAL